ncbi:PREDICTED: neutrophil collagenase [Bison bison bison]|uniref:Neutrophil collagenase n=1 Tax=Bison bison bison TaxID=43346 RepID=A0A6P3GS75_BISBB|nr:PREDICTED: neutrophil collagenase [Bison bison bison]
MIEKLKQMQEFFGLKVTGKIDADTLDIMRQSRCGVPDVLPQYGLTPGNPGWQSTHLTYRVENYTPDLSRADIEQAVEKAFQLWSSASPLTFTKVSEGQADVMISFVWGDHCDNSPFDGPGGIFAHAFQPGIGIGDVHLDEEEIWTKVLNNYNLYWVLAHELGHSFGLSHSTNIGALRYPNYIYTGEVYLSQDDISGIQAIYGNVEQPRVQTEKASLSVCECDNRITFDAVTKIHGELLFFKDRYVWRKHPRLRMAEFNFISLYWPSLPNGIQAAYEDFDRDLIFIFKGTQYWALSGYDTQQGYPRHISSYGFPSSVQAIDAAVSYRRKTYFFVNDQFWSYDDQSQSMEPGYPQSIASFFPGIESRVDAVFQENSFFLFFSGPRYYAFDFHARRVTRVDRSNRWLNCRYS